MSLKKLKNSLFLLLIVSMLTAFPQVVYSVSDNTADTSKSVTTLMPTKKEKKHVLNKFMVSMLWVLVSCGVVYGGLILYKRSQNYSITANTPERDIADELTTPSTIEEAVEFVIKKF